MLGFAVGVSTGRGGRKAAGGVDALDRGDAAEDSVAGVAGDIEQKPGDGGGIRRVDFGGELGGDMAAVVVLPGGPGKVLADRGSLLVVKKSFRGFEDPAFRTAEVNLEAAGVKGDDERRVGRSGDGGGDGHGW